MEFKTTSKGLPGGFFKDVEGNVIEKNFNPSPGKKFLLIKDIDLNGVKFKSGITFKLVTKNARGLIYAIS